MHAHACLCSECGTPPPVWHLHPVALPPTHPFHKHPLPSSNIVANAYQIIESTLREGEQFANAFFGDYLFYAKKRRPKSKKRAAGEQKRCLTPAQGFSSAILAFAPP